MDNFDFEDVSQKDVKNTIMKILMGVGIVALIAAIIGVLIMPSHIANSNICNELGLEGNILTGSCNTKYTQITYVVGDTQNSPKPQLNTPEYINLAYDGSSINSSISAISVSNPSKNPSPIISTDTEATSDERSSIVTDSINNMTASADGADYLEAIRTAARSADGKPALIYVIGSGLSDKGILNFADNNYISGDISAEEITEGVHVNNSQENYNNITIVWDGLGQTTPPQDSLSNNDINKLKDIYKEVLKKYGFSKINFINKLNSTEPTNTPKKVKTTHIIYSITRIYVDGETSAFQFIANTDKFLDESASNSEADSLIAKDIYTHPSGTIYITSHMAKNGCGNTTIDQSLLDSRLAAVENLLLSKGVTNKIVKTAGGLGSVDECPAGHYDESLAKQNRNVIFNISDK